jgi:16S rRNA (guanine1516-N2)-methyltransferase
MNLNSLIYLDSSLKESAQERAGQLSLNCVDGSSFSMNSKAQQKFISEQCMSQEAEFALVLGKDGLALHAINLQGNNVSIRADFHGATTTYRREKGGGKGQMIARAIGIKSGVSPHVLDATAGLGKDAFVLASLGCRVTLLERVPVIHALLEDAMKRARQFGVSEDSTLLEILDRMHLDGADALDYLNECAAKKRPDVVYLDPMFPVRTKSAQVKKEMQVLHTLVGTDDDAGALLEAALKCAQYRVIVKRPRIAAPLAEIDPSYALEGKRNRYDVYAIKKMLDGLNR